MRVTTDTEAAEAGFLGLLICGILGFGVFKLTGLPWLGIGTACTLAILGAVVAEEIRDTLIGLLLLGALGAFLWACC